MCPYMVSVWGLYLPSKLDCELFFIDSFPLDSNANIHHSLSGPLAIKDNSNNDDGDKQ